MSYSAFVLLPMPKPDTLAQLQRTLIDQPDFEEAGIELKGGGRELSVKFGDFAFELSHVSGESVVEEAREIMADAPPQLAGGREFLARLEISTKGDDPEMAHFNDYVRLCELAAALQQGVVFDPSTSEFL